MLTAQFVEPLLYLVRMLYVLEYDFFARCSGGVDRETAAMKEHPAKERFDDGDVGDFLVLGRNELGREPPAMYKDTVISERVCVSGLQIEAVIEGGEGDDKEPERRSSNCQHE